MIRLAHVAPLVLLVLLGGTMTSKAHVSEGGLVMLLPTGHYAAAGFAVVVVTALAMLALPDNFAGHLFRTWNIRLVAPKVLVTTVNLAAFVALLLLLASGWSGTRNPLENPLPLMVWTFWWCILIPVQSLLFDIWRWLNPFAGLARILTALRLLGLRSAVLMRLGHWPAAITWLAFVAFYLADIAPDDPARLANFAGGYLVWTAAGMVLTSPRWWLGHGEFVTVMMRLLSRLAALRRTPHGISAGIPGHGLVHLAPAPISLAMLSIAMLAMGSFDGINETFLWLAAIGVNPLEFPGRSAVAGSTVAGLLATILLFMLAFTAAITLGARLSGTWSEVRTSFRWQALALLPIIAGYHIAHYLTVFLVNGQYLLEMLTHWMEDRKGLAVLHHHTEVTTGFLNSTVTVQIIYFVQAGAVVAGHAIAIMAAHAIAERMSADRRTALLSHLPLVIVMLAYTLVGLWLLAAPRGA